MAGWCKHGGVLGAGAVGHHEDPPRIAAHALVRRRGPGAVAREVRLACRRLQAVNVGMASEAMREPVDWVPKEYRRMTLNRKSLIYRLVKA